MLTVGAACSGVGIASDSKVMTISRLAQWRIENIGLHNYRRSDPFKLGYWNWYLSVQKRNSYLNVRLFPDASEWSKEHPPMARFILRAWEPGQGKQPSISPVQECLLRTSEDFVWSIDSTFYRCFIIDVEFLDLKTITPLSGGEACSIWPYEGIFNTLSNKEKFNTLSNNLALQCLARMLQEGIHADVTINASNGVLKAHKAMLASSSCVFKSMFQHDLKEKESSMVDIMDMTQEVCSALLGYIYGTIKVEEFWKHRLSLLAAANKYDIADLKDCCEVSLMEDLNSSNIFDRLQEAWLYQLDKLKKECFTYLFDFGRIYDVKDEMNNFFRHADRELMLEVFQEVLTVWKPV